MPNDKRDPFTVPACNVIQRFANGHFDQGL
jgi:hypothetical protein